MTRKYMIVIITESPKTGISTKWYIFIHPSTSKFMYIVYNIMLMYDGECLQFPKTRKVPPLLPPHNSRVYYVVHMKVIF